jgi:hypothetical protein
LNCAGWKIRACKLTLTWQTGTRHIVTLASARLKEAEAAKKQQKPGARNRSRWRMPMALNLPVLPNPIETEIEINRALAGEIMKHE